MSLTKEERKERMESWDKHFLVQLVKDIDIKLTGNYFDYISGSDEWKNQAVLTRKYQNQEYTINIRKQYNNWWLISFESSRYSDENHKCKNPKAAVKYIEKMVAYKEKTIDLLIARKNMKKREEGLFSKMFGVPVEITNDPAKNYGQPAKNYEQQERVILLKVNNLMTMSFCVVERKTSLGFQMGSFSRSLTVEEIKKMIRIFS